MNRSARGKPAAPPMERRPDRLAVPPGDGEPASAVIPPLTADRLIGIREIRVLFGLGRTAAYALTHRPGFPAPVTLSARCYRWWAHEVAAFAADLRKQAPPAGQPASRRRATYQAVPGQTTPAPRITGKVRLARSRKQTS
jgi:predicted DNA-binding transcriptional regulator AlpA